MIRCRKLALGTLLGGVLLLGMSWPLLRPNPSVAAEREFRHEFQLFAEDEQKALIAQRTLDKLDASSKIMHREWGRRVAADIIPKWQSAGRPNFRHASPSGFAPGSAS